MLYRVSRISFVQSLTKVNPRSFCRATAYFSVIKSKHRDSTKNRARGNKCGQRAVTGSIIKAWRARTKGEQWVKLRERSCGAA